MSRMLAAVAVLACFACSSPAPSPSTCADCAPGTGAVRVALTMSTSGIGRVTVTVSAPDIGPAISQDLALAGDPPVASGVVMNVPAGASRTVTLEAHALAPEQDVVVYRGSATTAVGTGTIAPLDVTLRPVVKDLAVAATFPAADAGVAAVHHVAVAISGARIATPASFYLSMDAVEGVATGTVAAVPVGATRTVTVRAYDAGGTVLFSGAAATSVLEGATATAIVPLASGTGAIDVTGTMCVPACGGAVCGDDGCGGSCGGCQPGDACAGGQCVSGAPPDPAPASTAERTMPGISPVAIWGASASDVWLWSKIQGLPTGGLTEHWDGSTWTATTGIPGLSRIMDIWGSATDDVWAVGWLGSDLAFSELSPGTPPTGQIFHWNGTAWSPSYVTTSITFGAVWGSGPDDVWAAGLGEAAMLHWDGAAWSRIPFSTRASVSNLWGSGRDDLWAVTQEALYHWDGQGWTTTVLPLAPGQTTRLIDVWGSSSTDVWVVGDNVGGSSSPLQTYIWHWDGTSWSRQTFENLVFTDVMGSGPNDVWALAMNSAAHFDGTGWTFVAFDLSLYPALNLAGGWMAGPNDLWAIATTGIAETTGELLRLGR